MYGTGRMVIQTLKIIILCLIGPNNARIAISDQEESCKILVNGGFAEPQPLILDDDWRNPSGFVYPPEPGSGYLVTRTGESFRLACPGSRLNINTIDPYNETLVTCVGKNKFILQGTNLEESFNKISCERYPTAVAKRTGVPCRGGSSVQIGFPVRNLTSKKQKSSELYPVIDLCHNDDLGHTIYAHAKIVAEIGAAQTGFPRPGFRKGDFFRGIGISDVYGRDSQRNAIARILGSPELASRYIDQSGSYFFSRGHLIAKSDFVYGSHQRATFFYVNAVPMWQNINAGNWGIMEASVRSYASKRNMELDVWVGSYGILTLDDINGNLQKIFLHLDGKNRRAVPVPKVLFKVVYNYPTRSGIVFLTANNPYLTNITEEYRICNDVCHKIKYITWKLNRPDYGFSYCCTVDDFRRVFSGLPDFKTTRLLT